MRLNTLGSDRKCGERVTHGALIDRPFIYMRLESNGFIMLCRIGLKSSNNGKVLLLANITSVVIISLNPTTKISFKYSLSRCKP